MPRKKVPKRKVKDVKVPEGDEGKDLTEQERALKLDLIIQQMDNEVEQRLKDLDKDCRKTCYAIEHTGRSLILKLNPAEANMAIQEYRESLLSTTSKAMRDSGNYEAVDALLSDTAQVISQAPALKKHKVAGFATPAAGTSRQTLWTSTPQDTPMFDKRLLKVATGKPSGLSFNGQPINVDKIGKSKRKELTDQLSQLLHKLKEERC